MVEYLISILGLGLLAGSWALIQRMCDRVAPRPGNDCRTCGPAGCLHGIPSAARAGHGVPAGLEGHGSPGRTDP